MFIFQHILNTPCCYVYKLPPLSYCSVAPCLHWLEAPPSFTVSFGANSIMDNAIEKAMSWKRMMLHMDITLISYVSFSIELLTIVLLWVMPSCKCCCRSTNTKPLAIAKAPSPEHCCLNTERWSREACRRWASMLISIMPIQMQQ